LSYPVLGLRPRFRVWCPPHLASLPCHLLLRPPFSPLLPYTTLFRSHCCWISDFFTDFKCWNGSGRSYDDIIIGKNRIKVLFDQRPNLLSFFKVSIILT